MLSSQLHMRPKRREKVDTEFAVEAGVPAQAGAAADGRSWEQCCKKGVQCGDWGRECSAGARGLKEKERRVWSEQSREERHGVNSVKTKSVHMPLVSFTLLRAMETAVDMATD